ncbi:MAG: exodeoxyribonuclease III [Pseudomonadota bacterium]
MSAPLTVVTWNINSVRARLDLLSKMIRKVKPDVICLQETRCDNAVFPKKHFTRRGYKHFALNGRGGHHGVAIVSKHPLDAPRAEVVAEIDHPRHVSAIVDHGGPIRLHSLYVPSGGDEPDRTINQKFDEKLRFLDAMATWGATEAAEPALMTGDFNVAPHEDDVWSHKQLVDVVSHTPQETERLNVAQASGHWVDIVRRDRPPPEKIYTWWSYRNKTWPGSNRGRRLDHIWASPPVADRVSVTILTEARGWEKASDHVPLIATVAPSAVPKVP